jgi:hypothetical protein
VTLALITCLGCSSSDDPSASGDPGGTGSGAASGAGAGTPTSGAGGHTGGSSSTSTGSGGLPPVDASCGLDGAAFCDAFTKPSPGGRAGALDDAKWSMARLGFGCSPGFAFPETALNLCGTWQDVQPGGPDSQFCLTEDNDPRWVEGFDDNGDFNYLSARIRQPFDFAGRTGTIQWEADARTSGSHGWWVETWITEDPIPGPNFHAPDQLVTSRRAIGITLDLNCGVPASGLGTAGAGKVGVSQILIADEYGVTNHYDPFAPGNDNARCVTTEQGKLNKVQFKISETRVEVWATGVQGEPLERIAETDVNVGFSRGYAHISHVHYNAHKAEVPSFQAYQWARAAFDGPQLPTPRAYQIADPLTPAQMGNDCAQAYRIAYAVTDGKVYDFGDMETPITLKFTGVDPSGGTSARMNFSTSYVNAGDMLRYRFNGGAWHDYQVPAIQDSGARQGFSVPVEVSELVAGDNTVEFGANADPPNMYPDSMHIANIDLEIEAP